MNASRALSTMSISEYFRLLSGLLGKQTRKYFFWLAVIFLVYFHFLLPPFLVGKAVDFLTAWQEGNSLKPLYLYAALLGAAWALAAMVRIEAKTSLNALAIFLGYRARVQGFERLMDQSIRWHEQESTGNKVQRIQTGSTALQEFLNVLHSGGLPVICNFVGVIGAFILMHWSIAAFALVYLLLFLCIHVRFIKRAKRIIEQSKRALEQASGTYIEGAHNILTIKTLGLGGRITENVLQREKASRDLKLSVARLNFGKWRLFQLCTAFGLTVFLLIIGNAVTRHVISPGQVLVLFSYFRSLAEAAGESTGLFDQLLEQWLSVARLKPIFEAESSVHGGDKSFPSAWDAIRLTNATVAHPNGRGGIFDLSFTISRGETVAIVGESGSGKSTLARTLLGIYPLDRGSYEIGCVPFSMIHPSERSQHLSMVLQESELFNLSLRENITLMRDIDEASLQLAIEIAQLQSLIALLPEGLDTLIGEKGYRLSGGERQRLGIARAICHNPDILVLDEATSALDPATERRLLQALKEKLRGKTLVVIAHRLSTIQDIGRLLVFSGGRLVEEGSWESLQANKESAFSALLRAAERQAQS